MVTNIKELWEETEGEAIHAHSQLGDRSLQVEINARVPMAESRPGQPPGAHLSSGQ